MDDNSSSVYHSDQSLLDTDGDQDQEQVDEEETENEFVIGDFVHQDIFGTEEIIAVLFLVFAASLSLIFATSYWIFPNLL